MTKSYEEIKKMVPKGRQLLWPAIQAMQASNAPLRYGDIAHRVAEIMNLPEEVASTQDPNHPRSTVLSYKIAWVLTELKNAQLVQNQKAHWKLTEIGEGADQAKVEDICEKARKSAAQKSKERLLGEGGHQDAQGRVPPRQQIEKSKEDQLLDTIAHLDLVHFENVMRNFLGVQDEPGHPRSLNGENGWVEFEKPVRIIPGVETLISIWCGDKVKVVSEEEVQLILDSASEKADRIAIITVGEFSQDAKALATQTISRRITLIDGLELAKLMRSSGMG